MSAYPEGELPYKKDRGVCRTLSVKKVGLVHVPVMDPQWQLLQYVLGVLS